MPSLRFGVLFSGWVAFSLATNVRAQLPSCGSDPSNLFEPCYVSKNDINSGCSSDSVGFCGGNGGGELLCFSSGHGGGTSACEAEGCRCFLGVCAEESNTLASLVLCSATFEATPVCGDDVVCDDPHMQGLRGQRIDWSGEDGGWYSLVKDTQADLHINVRLTAPLADEFPDRQLITGVSIISEGRSLAIEVDNPYTTATEGCPADFSPCLANGGLRAVVDGDEVNDILRFSDQALVADGQFLISGSNLPVECRQFGGDKIWAHMYDEMLRGERVLRSEGSFEEWILSFHNMAAPEWCIKYIAEHELAELQSTHAIFKIETSAVTVRVNAGVNHQGDGELGGDGRLLPNLEFWQMDIGLDGLDIDSPSLSGILGETARPVYDENGRAVMEGLKAIRGNVEDYRVAGPVGTHFALLDEEDHDHE